MRDLKLAALAAVSIALAASPARAQDVLGSWRATGSLGSEALDGRIELSGTFQSLEASFTGKLGSNDVALVGTGNVIGASDAGRAVVTAGKLNFRAGASTQAQVLAVALRGTEIEVLGSQGTFTRVRLPGNPLVYFCATAYLAPAGEARALILSLQTKTGLAGSISGETPAAPKALLVKVVRSSGYRFDGSALFDGNVGAVTLERDAPAVSTDVVRFVLEGTSRPATDWIITLARVEGTTLRRVADLRTDARGEARPPSTPLSGTLRAVLSRRAISDAELAARPLARTDEVDAGMIRGGAVVGVRYTGPTLKKLHERLSGASWQVGSGGFRWDQKDHDWKSEKLDCISSALFGLSYATDLGERGAFKPFALENMMKAKDKRSFVPNSCYANLLSVAFGTEENYERLAHANSVYKGVCLWPWAKMRWGWEGTSACGCGLHVTPRTIKDNTAGLGELNILSMSQAKKRPGEPMSTWQMKYEYSVLLLYKRPSDGKLFTCHSGHWKAFEEEVDYWAIDSWGSAVTDVRYIVWKLAPGQVDPLFWLDEQGRPFTPPEVATSPIDR